MNAKYTRFREIPPFTKQSPYGVDVSWKYLEDHLQNYEHYGLDMCPDFQRGHVWDEERQIKYVEFALRGGLTGRNIYFNCPNFSMWTRRDATYQGMKLVDGLQRITAARRFLNNEIPAFQTFYSEYEDSIGTMEPSFKIHVNDLKTRAEVLQWYLEMNDGGVVHAPEEIARVRALLEKEKKRSKRIPENL